MTVLVHKISNIVMTYSDELSSPLATISAGQNKITGFLKSEIQFALPDLQQEMTVDIQDVQMIDIASSKSPKDQDVKLFDILEDIASIVTPETIKEAGEKTQRLREAVKEVYVSDDDVEEAKRRTEITRQQAEQETIKAGKVKREPEEQLPFEERMLQERKRAAQRATAITDSIQDLIGLMNKDLEKIDKDQYPELYERARNVWMNIIMASGEK